MAFAPQSGKHLVIPEQHSSEVDEQLRIARGKLQLVPNKMFEELVMDLYDEVDRRENEASKGICGANRNDSELTNYFNAFQFGRRPP